MIITENQLDEWVRRNSSKAQGEIVELVFRLVAASSPKPIERRFPLGDSIGQPGPDGILNTEYGYNPFVPLGKSYWEIGSGEKANKKATNDYKIRTSETPIDERKTATFIFVTPSSGRKDWQYTWKEAAQATWIKRRVQRKEWKDVRVIDGSRIIDWLHNFPSVERWLAHKMEYPISQIDTPEQRWSDLKTIGAPPPLIPQLFLINRDEACKKMKDVFAGNSLQLQIDTHYPEQMADFISAYIATLDEPTKSDVVNRCLIVKDADAWNVICGLKDHQILIADFSLDDTDSFGVRLLEKAKRAGHSIIHSGKPSGPPHPNRVSIPNPKIFQIKEVLEKTGYKEERARSLATKSDGNLNILLKCLQNLSLMPEWAQGPDAADLAIAELLGEWQEQSEADKAVVERLSKKAYGEWIGKMREIALRPGTPLIQREGDWKVITRYEGWYALGPRLFDEHLERFKEAAISVLRERDPKFELLPNERYAASIHGKVMIYSRKLRNGLAESLALLGSHYKALTSCSVSRAETTAVLVVREILTSADWVLWASLNDLLPLLAEAAPSEFLDVVENALRMDPCPFDNIFRQESSGIMGNTYISGLLWALETLAWDAKFFTKSMTLLGELAARDPGGNWANRPANSLTAILLPWLPQTCAPVSMRLTTVKTLLCELPDITWKILLNLLPHSQQVSSYTRKPAWREMIPDDWSRGVIHQEYMEQTIGYTQLAITAAKQESNRLVELIDHIAYFPPPAFDQLLTYLRSDIINSMPQADRLRLWNKLVDLVSRHRKFADTEWAMKQAIVDELDSVAENLAPDKLIYRHQRLFSERDYDLYEKKDNFKEQYKELEDRRKKAVNNIFIDGGLEDVLEFAKSVESPWRVGVAFGMTAPSDIGERILPAYLDSEFKSLGQFVGGFVLGSFREHMWQWVDNIDLSKWTPSQKGQFFAYLTFTPDTWKRVTKQLKEDELPYWSKTTANPYETKEDLKWAIDRLIQYGRPLEAIQCLERAHYDNQPMDSKQIIRVLQAVLHSSIDTHAMDVSAIVDVIKILQNDSQTDPNELFQIEWAFLPLLDNYTGSSPKLLEQRLAEDSVFFCEVIRLVFRSKKEEKPVEEITEQQEKIVTNAYRLLHNWRTPPGSQRDGTYNGNALTSWLEKVKVTCEYSGHLEIALSIVGHVLIYTPTDPSGLWLHHSAAKVLNDKDTNDMREGFITGLFNSRGIFTFTAGQEEGKLAAKYRAQAEEIESHGYHRLADSLKKLSASYEKDAEREASRDSFDY
jgi:hypothetical protein